MNALTFYSFIACRQRIVYTILFILGKRIIILTLRKIYRPLEMYTLIFGVRIVNYKKYPTWYFHVLFLTQYICKILP